MNTHWYCTERKYFFSTGNYSWEASLDHMPFKWLQYPVDSHSSPVINYVTRSFSSLFFLVEGFSVEFIAEFYIIGSQKQNSEFYTIEYNKKWVPPGFICLLFMLTSNNHWENESA